MNDETAAALTGWVRDRREQLITDLTHYAELETPSADAELLATGLSWIETWLGERLGSPAERRVHHDPSYGDTVVLDYPAADEVGQRWVTALCHYDTVWSAGTLADWPVSLDRQADTLTGPGVFDMKGGLVQLVWALSAVGELGLPRPNLRLVLNPDEEIGSPSSRAVIETEVVRGDAVLVFEAAAAGALKTQRKGVGIFDLEVRGVEVHAGLDPTSGASAIDELARMIITLHDAADLDAGTTLNVGVVSGGTRSNVKAGRAEARLDVRVASDAEARRIDTVLAELRPVNPLAAISVTGGWNRPVMERSEQTAALFALASEVAGELGQSLAEVSVGGASDGNFAAALGLGVLDGFGAVGDGAHARHEHISVPAMLERTALTAGVLAALAGPPPG